MSEINPQDEQERKFKNQQNLESAQEDQNDVGAAESDPSTTGPTENVRKEASDAVDNSESDKDSV